MVHKGTLVGWLLAAAAGAVMAQSTDRSLVPHLPAIAQTVPANGSPLAVQVLDAALGDPSAAAVTGGSLEGHFGPFEARGSHFRTARLWFRLPPLAGNGTESGAVANAGVIPVLLARTGMDQNVQVYASRGGEPVALAAPATVLLYGRADDAQGLFYYGLAPSMVAAAVLIALGTSDRGDACLAAIIAPIHAELPQSDTIGRCGGEEFVVILSGADAASAHPIAERICRRVAEVRVEGFAPPNHLTCSIGVAASDTLGVWGQHLLAHADTAQYAAKRSGRNQVHLAVALAAF